MLSKGLFKVLPVDTPTMNGNIYPREVVEAALAEYGDDDVFVHCGGDSLQDVVGILTDLRVESDCVVGNFTLLGVPKARWINKVIDDGNVRIQLTGYGNVASHTFLVSNYSIKNAYLTLNAV